MTDMPDILELALMLGRYDINPLMISAHHTIKWSDIEANTWFPWDWRGISRNPNITMKIIKDNPDKPWNWKFVSDNPNVRICDVMSLPRRSWSFYKLSRNPGIRWCDVKKYPRLWSYRGLSSNQNVTLPIIESNMHLPWDWFEMRLNPNITVEFALKYPEKTRTWDLDLSLIATWEEILANPNIHWHPCLVSRNPNITLDIIRANPKGLWSDDIKFGNPHYFQHPAFWWCHDAICRNPNFTWDMMQSHEHICEREYNGATHHLRWNLRWAAGNPNVTPRMIIDSIIAQQNVKWKYSLLWKNPRYNREKADEEERREIAVATSRIIYDELITVTCHPSRHPATWRPLCELNEHPLATLTPYDVKELFNSTKDEVN